jgi:2-keto-3-deoxy-L-rhamnonate aldolase RhmA
VRVRWFLTIAGLCAAGSLAASQAPHRLNPIIELLEQKKPVFGLYAPANRGGRGAAAAADAPAPKTAAQLAQDAIAYKAADYIFDSSMEGNFDRGYATFSEFVKGMAEAGALQKSPQPRLTHPLMVKMHRIGTDRDRAAADISRQLNLGVSGIVFVGVESAEELKAGIAAMRFKSKGGTRPDDVGSAPAYWGLSEAAYREKADLWPLNPNGELLAWAIVESKEGIGKVREIAAVPGVAVLFPGAGTLRGVYSTTDASGQRVRDPVAWEAALQEVLAACKEFKVPCGFPATENDIAERMKQGFGVFVINWGDAGFRAVDLGRKTAGR